MPSILAVQASQNVADVEKRLAQLYQLPGSIDLLLPTQLKNWQAGGAAALIQLIVTWAKHNPAANLITHVQDGTDAALQLGRLANEDHGLVAILMAKNILSRSGSHSLRTLAYAAAKARIELMAMGIRQAHHGPELCFLCADHTTKAYLNAFYHRTDHSTKLVKSRRDFAAFARACITSTLSPLRNWRPMDQTFLDLGIVLHELFHNTDEWAKTGVDGRRLSRSVRGIRFELTARTPEAVAKTVQGCVPLERYVANDDLHIDSAHQQLLEVSVFDSGPGLASRFLQREITDAESIATEHQAALQCLTKRATTSHITHRGVGLHRVMQTVSKARGFLRIRSGRLSLFRDFAQIPYDIDREGSPVLTDWTTGQMGQASAEPRAEGTLITILLPILLESGD